MDEWKIGFQRFESDNFSGSAELVKQYIDLLQYSLDKVDLRSDKDKAYLISNLNKVRQSHRSFFVLLHFYNEIMNWFNEDTPDWNSHLLEFLREYQLAWSDINRKVAGHALASIIELNKKTVLCHSQSSAVKELFRIYTGNKKNIKIFQTESRPVLEGQMQAKFLAGLGYPVTLIIDQGFTRHLDEINLILLGADAVYKDFFVNKAGSYSICLAGKNAGIPVYVLADSRKFWKSQNNSESLPEHREDPKPEMEIWHNPARGVAIENYYFEEIPNQLVDGFISEDEIINL